MTENTNTPQNQFFKEYSLREFRAVAALKTPKAHQQDALFKLGRWYKSSTQESRGAILVLPTGGGKTFTAVRFLCEHALSDGYKVLWLAHTHHLLEQAMQAFDDSAGSILEPKSALGVRVVSGATGHCRIHQIKASDDVVVGSLQALCKAFAVSHESLIDFVRAAGPKLLVVFDEAHHAPAPSYRRLLVQLRESCHGMLLLGLTATPFYSDEKKAGWLRKLFPQGIIHQVTANALMASGVLAQPVIEEARTKIEVSVPDDEYARWVNTNRDIPEDVVTSLAERRERNEFIANYYVENRNRLGKTIIFADRWAQCEALCTLLKKRGIRADAVYSYVYIDRTSPEERNIRTASQNSEILTKFKRGDLDVLVNVRMLTEGTDVPDVQTVFLTRQTTSQSLLVQMIGRALRGPAVGGTPKAYIVSFIDDWQQRVKWAEYATLAEGQADDTVPDYAKRPPIQLISIDLIRRLAAQMDSGINSNPAAFATILPSGWYHVEYDTLLTGTDETETLSQMVLVYEHDKEGFKGLFTALLSQDLQEFEEPSAELDHLRPRLEILGRQCFPDFGQRIGVSADDLFSVARHVAQNERMVPRFFEFADRDKHNLDALAERFIQEDKGPRAIEAALRFEFTRDDLFWRAIYSRYEQFKSTFDGCMNYVLRRQNDPLPAARPEARTPERLENSEPSIEVKEEVFERDYRQCLCCGTTDRLRVDHVKSRYRGGGNESENLQTLCTLCNSVKSTDYIDFRKFKTPLSDPPSTLPDHSHIAQAGTEWSECESRRQALRRWINFFYRCAAVDALEIENKPDGRRTMKLRLKPGNDRLWLEPHLSELRTLARVEAPHHGLPAIENESDDAEVDSMEVETPHTSPEPVRLDEVLESIRSVEGFEVRIRNADDRRVRGDLVLHGYGPYPFRRKLNESKTINTWKIDRFFAYYPLFDSSDYRVEVLDGDGSDRSGNTKLRTLRDSYFL